MKKKFLSAVLSLSVMATGVTPCFAIERVSMWRNGTGRANYSVAKYLAMENYCREHELDLSFTKRFYEYVICFIMGVTMHCFLSRCCCRDVAKEKID